MNDIKERAKQLKKEISSKEDISMGEITDFFTSFLEITNSIETKNINPQIGMIQIQVQNHISKAGANDKPKSYSRDYIHNASDLMVRCLNGIQNDSLNKPSL